MLHSIIVSNSKRFACLFFGKSKTNVNIRENINNFASNSIFKFWQRLKVVLIEKKRTSKWLAETLDKYPATVSK